MISYFSLSGKLTHTDTKEFNPNAVKYSFQVESSRERKGEPMIYEVQAWGDAGEKAMLLDGREVWLEGNLSSWRTEKGYYLTQLNIVTCRLHPVFGEDEADGEAGGRQESAAPEKGKDDFDDDIPF